MFDCPSLQFTNLQIYISHLKKHKILLLNHITYHDIHIITQINIYIIYYFAYSK